MQNPYFIFDNPLIMEELQKLKAEVISITNHQYSLEEQIVETWIDGKAIYEITIDLSKVSDRSNIDVSNLKIDKLISCDVLASDSTGYTDAKFTYATTSGMSGRIAYIDSTNHLRIDGNFYKAYVILKYTKEV